MSTFLGIPGAGYSYWNSDHWLKMVIHGTWTSSCSQIESTVIWLSVYNVWTQQNKPLFAGIYGVKKTTLLMTLIGALCRAGCATLLRLSHLLMPWAHEPKCFTGLAHRLQIVFNFLPNISEDTLQLLQFKKFSSVKSACGTCCSLSGVAIIVTQWLF